MSLTVSDLACRRAGRLVLAELSFALSAGEALLLTGPNGAGKSTLLRALAGLLPYRGRIALDETDARDRDAWAEAVAYAGHLDAIKPALTVGENLGFWAGLFGAPPGAAPAALDRFGLTALAERPAHACSAGQKRRLGLARLLLAPRRLWLLDEPTVSLDAEAASGLAQILREHCSEGGLAVIATHAPIDLPARSLSLEARSGAAADDPFLSGAFA